MHLVTYLEFLRQTEQGLGHSYRIVSEGHPADADVHYATVRLAGQCDTHVDALTSVLTSYQPAAEGPPERLHITPMSASRAGPVGLLRDLQDLYQLANLVDITWALVGQAAHGARDQALLRVVDDCAPQTTGQLAWLRMRMKAAAPQTLLVAP